mmetsp:Transcript_10789/g.39079  ORF Transcript_10789/g.39079 Transcript_10789/m.39079 type:complete len:347 (-) Transcript_10789:2437-3477(-)
MTRSPFKKLFETMSSSFRFTLRFSPLYHLLLVFIILVIFPRNRGPRGGLVLRPSFASLEREWPVEGEKKETVWDEPCDWPPPLYQLHVEGENHSAIYTSLNSSRDFFIRNFSFAYIDTGGALGLFRDGSIFIVGDSDVDVRFGICKACTDSEALTMPQVHSFISFNDFEVWGDRYRSEKPESVTMSVLQRVHKDLCLNEIGPDTWFWTLKSVAQKKANIYNYGEFWFVRVPFKGFHDLEKWYSYATSSGIPWQINWKATLSVLRQIDTNLDNHIDQEEMEKRIKSDGINLSRYYSQISLRERCRAAAQMTFFLKFAAEPFEITDEDSLKSEHALFEFPECNANESI